MTDIVNLEAGRELDTLVAEKVMGWTDWREDSGGRRIKAPGENSRPFSPSTDIGDAFEVAAKIGTNFVLEWIKDPKMFVAAPWPGTGPWIAGLSGETCMRGETAPLAICRMALVAAEHESVKR
jgi:hypothetical protein